MQPTNISCVTIKNRVSTRAESTLFLRLRHNKWKLCRKAIKETKTDLSPVEKDATPCSLHIITTIENRVLLY